MRLSLRNCIRCPGAARRKIFASILELTFAQGIRRVYKMQFMFSICVLK